MYAYSLIKTKQGFYSFYILHPPKSQIYNISAGFVLEIRIKLTKTTLLRDLEQIL